MRQLLTQGPETLERLFAPEERAYALARKEPEQHLAGIFAAKEALAKAVRSPELLGTYGRAVTVGHREDGVAYLRLSHDIDRILAERGIRVADLSISHDGEYAMAAVLVEVTESPAATAPAGEDWAREEPAACRRCLLSLDYLSAQGVTDFLVPVRLPQGGTGYVCPVCLRGW